MIFMDVGIVNYLNPPSKTRVDAGIRSGDSVENVRFELLSLPLYAVEALPLL